MKPAEEYKGREQTYIKHFFLERYLERVAYNIGSFASDFVYVDGFSGPWQSYDEALQDTSFMIAINKLRAVRSGLAKVGRSPQIRCLFIEKDPEPFSALKTAVQSVTDIQAVPLQGSFEDLIPDISRFVGRRFALIFIDPTGWTGFGLRRIESLLRHCPGEVIVNFMFDYINRFLDTPSPELSPSFDELFGGPGWEDAIRATSRREQTIIDFYCARMRTIGGFNYVTSTRILNPTKDRTYYYLVYGTRHPKGLIEFRRVEENAMSEQERVRLDAKESSRLQRTQQPLLLPISELGISSNPHETERIVRLRQAETSLLRLLDKYGRMSYDTVLATMLETPLVFESDVKSIIRRLENTYLCVEGLKPRQRVPHYGQGQVLVKT